MKRLLIFSGILVSVLFAAACSEKEEKNGKESKTATVTLNFSGEGVSSYDDVCIFNDADLTTLRMKARKNSSATLPAAAKTLYAIIPAPEKAEKGPSKVPFAVPGSVRAVTAIERPMAASATIEGGICNLVFSPFGAVITLSIFKSGASGAEKISAISVGTAEGGLSGEDSQVDLTAPLFAISGCDSPVAITASSVLAASKSDAKNICFLAGNALYGEMRITVVTDQGSYSFSRKGVDCTKDGATVEADLAASDVVFVRDGNPGMLADLIVDSPATVSDTIPDFSRIGYRYGDSEIPDYPVVRTLEAPSDGADATSLIQNAIDSHTGTGAILLKAGTYCIDGTLSLAKDGLVLRGEGPSTILYSRGKTQKILLTLGKPTSRTFPGAATLIDLTTRIPIGATSVPVKDASAFSVGDRVAICYDHNSDWVHDLRMDQIPERTDDLQITQWDAGSFNMVWERTVTAVSGGRVWFENPIVEPLEEKYGTATLKKCSFSRISESGVENLFFDTEYDKSLGDQDENHAWTAIQVRGAENCWIRGIKSAHFGFGQVRLSGGAKNVTVENCVCTEPISVITGSRRYAFHIDGGEMCLVRDCTCDKDRHGFATGSKVPGPSAYLRCSGTNMHADLGPHQRWATGVLYDCCKTDNQLNVQDRSNMGSGHGWTAVGFVMWNCECAKGWSCQSNWIGGKNWAVGCTGPAMDSSYTLPDRIPRPRGVWVSPGAHVSPVSLYDSQLAARKAAN